MPLVAIAAAALLVAITVRPSSGVCPPDGDADIGCSNNKFCATTKGDEALNAILKFEMRKWGGALRTLPLTPPVLGFSGGYVKAMEYCDQVIADWNPKVQKTINNGKTFTCGQTK